MKKILVTRKLLNINEERIRKIWNAKLNKKDEIYPNYQHLHNVKKI